ncbi:MAG TPA: hypothetical protein VIK38_05600 [Coriobacteriia bacterium]
MRLGPNPNRRVARPATSAPTSELAPHPGDDAERRRSEADDTRREEDVAGPEDAPEQVGSGGRARQRSEHRAREDQPDTLADLAQHGLASFYGRTGRLGPVDRAEEHG